MSQPPTQPYAVSTPVRYSKDGMGWWDGFSWQAASPAPVRITNAFAAGFQAALGALIPFLALGLVLAFVFAACGHAATTTTAP